MEQDSDRVRRIGPRESDEMEVIGNGLFSVAVPFDSDPEFKAYILAAGTAHAWGNKSIDNIFRRHGDEWVRRFEEQESESSPDSVLLRRTILRRASSRCRELSELKLPENASYGAAAAANAMIRLESTFRAASHLVWLGFAFESEAVIRLGFEQVAWSYAVHALRSDQGIESISGESCMTQLKTLFPGAGRIYGRLSDLAHVAPRTHSRFTSVADGKTTISVRSPAASRESCLLLVILLDAFLLATERCFADAGITCEGVTKWDGSPISERSCAQLVEDFSGALPRNSREAFRAWREGE